MSIKTHTFNGINYEIDISGPIDGICRNPRNESRPSLRVCTNISTRKGLETLIHESLHACFWAKSEEKVEQTAYDVARLLWRLGFRCKQ